MIRNLGNAELGFTKRVSVHLDYLPYLPSSDLPYKQCKHGEKKVKQLVFKIFGDTEVFLCVRMRKRGCVEYSFAI